VHAAALVSGKAIGMLQTGSDVLQAGDDEAGLPIKSKPYSLIGTMQMSNGLWPMAYANEWPMAYGWPMNGQMSNGLWPMQMSNGLVMICRQALGSLMTD